MADLNIAFKLFNYLLVLGTNIDTNLTILTPFEHWLNTKFVISAIEKSNNQQPNWISIDQQYQTITIARSSIKYVQSVILIISARLFAISTNEEDIKTSSTSIINFINNNLILVSAEYSYYIVFSKIILFHFVFKDDEDDNVRIKLVESTNYGAFVKYTNSSAATVMIQANTVLDDPVTFNFMYTDSYHQNSSDFKTFSTYLYLFATNPPYFKQDLISVLGDKCYDIQFMLPEITDPNGENVTVKLAPNTPDWISIRDNSVVYISSASRDNVAEGLTEIEIILQNESKAWSNYPLNVTIDQLVGPDFGSISDYQLSQLSGNGVLINVTSISKVYVVDWAGNNLISFLQFNNSMLSLKENTANSNLLDTTWVKLASLDSCNSTVYSNPFNIASKAKNRPPVLFLNNEQFVVPKGIYTLFKLPIDTFVDFDGDNLIYQTSVVKCTQKHNFDVGVGK